MRLTAGCGPCDECLAWASNENMVVEFKHLKFPWKKVLALEVVHGKGYKAKDDQHKNLHMY